MEEWKKAAWSNKSHFALHHVDSQVCVGRLPGCSVGRWQSSRESLMLWAMFSWRTLGPAVHVGATNMYQLPKHCLRACPPFN